MGETDLILDFAAHLGRAMLQSGANLERVNDTMLRVCDCYELEDISLFNLSTVITVSAVSPGGECGTRQLSVPAVGIHLEQLQKLNALSRKVCSTRPAPAELAGLLQKTQAEAESYPVPMVLLGYLVAMSCLCLLFEGDVGDVIAADLNTLALYGISRLLAQPGLNKIITNTVSMLMAGCLALFFVKIGLSHNFWAVIITNAFYLIPGIPMVNSMRNLLCGNEMNGMLDLFKVVLEAVCIVLGLVLSIYLFGGSVLA